MTGNCRTYLQPSTWRLSTPTEVSEFIKKEGARRQGSFLIVHSKLKPVDVYTYLRARFGEPNGVQNLFRSDSSDNWIHWDYTLKAGSTDINICGASRECHILVTESLSNDDWKSLLEAIKADFSRVAAEKTKTLRSLEKFVVFQNKFVSIANLCADLHSSIMDAREVQPEQPGPAGSVEELSRPIEDKGRRAAAIYGDCLKLRLLMPIMAEAFINLVILTLCKPAIRQQRDEYETFLRETIPNRIENLHEKCHGFERPIDNKSEAYSNFQRVIARRNFDLHGNMDPQRDAIETVYFDGKRPLFVEPGHHIEKFFEHLDCIHMPEETLADYENVHSFLVEITHAMHPKVRTFFEHVSADPYPGYEVNKCSVTSILPEQIMMCILPDAPYDDQL